jgi:hypothetical protein
MHFGPLACFENLSTRKNIVQGCKIVATIHQADKAKTTSCADLLQE